MHSDMNAAMTPTDDKATQTIQNFVKSGEIKGLGQHMGDLESVLEQHPDASSNSDSEDDMPLKLVLARHRKTYNGTTSSTAQSIDYADGILQIQQSFPWVSCDRCSFALDKFDGNVEKATEWILTTMCECDIKQFEVQIILVRAGMVWYRQEATQTDEQ